MLHTAGAGSCGFPAMSSNWYYLLTTRMTDESLSHESLSETKTPQKMLCGYPVIFILTHNLQVMKFLDLQIPGSFLRVIQLPLQGSTHRRCKICWAKPLDHCALERKWDLCTREGEWNLLCQSLRHLVTTERNSSATPYSTLEAGGMLRKDIPCLWS